MAFRGVTPEDLVMWMQWTVVDPPPGEIADFESPSPFRSTTLALVVIMLTISTAFVAMRMYTRQIFLNGLWWDDYFSLFAWMMFVGYTGYGLLTTLVHRGPGIHIWDLHFSDFVQSRFDAYVLQILFDFSILAVKISILFQILRIFVPTRNGNATMFYTVTSLIVANTVFYTIELFLDVFRCSPIESIWNFSLSGTCLAHGEDYFSVPTAAIDLVSDLILFFLPVNRIWRLQMPARRKVGVSLVFATGLLACVTSALHLYYAYLFTHTIDGIYYEALFGDWLYAELSIGIIIGCMPSCPKFFSEMKQRWRNSWTRISALSLRQDSAVQVQDHPRVGGKLANPVTQWQGENAV